ncbi:TPA: MBL fold metallo-hydrolase [Clostridioides difficile]|nr:MBL fold metallo-hydrolase [Clostridioides difficile]
MQNIKRIILIHCHCDHIGGTAELVREYKNRII